MQAISTKFLPATNVKGSRVKATCQARSIILHWDHAENSDTNHTRAAHKLADMMGWSGRWFGGGHPNGIENVFVCADPHFAVGSFNVEKRAA